MRKWVNLNEDNIIIGSFESDIQQEHAIEVFTDVSSEELCGLIFVDSNNFKEDITSTALIWRDSELFRTDSLMLLSDYPYKDELTIYRQALRDWPATPDFPDTRPTLGI